MEQNKIVVKIGYIGRQVMLDEYTIAIFLHTSSQEELLNISTIKEKDLEKFLKSIKQIIEDFDSEVIKPVFPPNQLLKNGKLLRDGDQPK